MCDIDSFDQDRDVGGEIQPCAEPEPVQHLLAVEIMDGGDNVAAAPVTQYVNLPRENKWTNVTQQPILNIDRLSEKLRVKVRFQVARDERFKLRQEPGIKNTEYSDGERGGNPKYLYSPQGERNYRTGGSAEKIVANEFTLAAAGGDTYSVHATYVPAGGDAVVETQQSVQVETKRRVWVKRLKMHHDDVGPPADIGSPANVFGDLGVELVDADHGAALETITHRINATPRRLKQDVQASSAPPANWLQEYGPYLLVVAYTDQLAVKERKIVKRKNVTVGPGQPDVIIPIVGGGGRALSLWDWPGLPGDWFVQATFKRKRSWAVKDTFKTREEVNIPEARCAAQLENPVNPKSRDNRPNRVRINVQNLVPAHTEGTITLEVNTVNRMRLGLAYPKESRLICLAARAWGENRTAEDMDHALIHEIGHKFGMVPDGSDMDKTPYLYKKKGHAGPHCHKGLPNAENYPNYVSANPGAKPCCVMFGQGTATKFFCIDCEKAVEKVDLSQGWSQF